MTASVLSRMVAPLSVYSLSRVRAFPTRVSSESTRSCHESPRVSPLSWWEFRLLITVIYQNLLTTVTSRSPLSRGSGRGGGVSRWFACCILCVFMLHRNSAQSERSATHTYLMCHSLCAYVTVMLCGMCRICQGGWVIFPILSRFNCPGFFSVTVLVVTRCIERSICLAPYLSQWTGTARCQPI